MREEDITIIPAKEGVKISYKFLPFVNTRSQDFVASVSQHYATETNTVPSVKAVDNVAELYFNNSSPIIHEMHILTIIPTKHPQTTKQNEHNALVEALKIVSGSVTESTLLQAQSVSKVRASLKGISGPVTAIALSEPLRVRRINLETGIYHTNRGKTEVFFINTLHTDASSKKGTELELSQISEAVEIVNNQDLMSDENEEIAQVFL